MVNSQISGASRETYSEGVVERMDMAILRLHREWMHSPVPVLAFRKYGDEQKS